VHNVVLSRLSGGVHDPLTIGWGGLFAVMLARRYGRLPVLFWSQARDFVIRCYLDLSVMVQLLALGFLVGCTFAPNLKTFTG